MKVTEARWVTPPSDPRLPENGFQASLGDKSDTKKMGCLYVGWNDQYDEWVFPMPLAGHSVTLGHLLDVIDSYSAALEGLLGAP